MDIPYTLETTSDEHLWGGLPGLPPVSPRTKGRVLKFTDFETIVGFLLSQIDTTVSKKQK